MKLYNQKLVLYEMQTLEQAGAVRTLRESDLLSWEAKTTLLDTSYSGVSVQYINTDGETMTYTYTGLPPAGTRRWPKSSSLVSRPMNWLSR